MNKKKGLLTNLYKAITLMLLEKVPFLKNLSSLDKETSEGADILLELCQRLINESKKKIENNEKLESMLDYMVHSHLNGTMSQEE
jgi:hypothetical protein